MEKSDCKHAQTSETGMIWCDKYQRYASAKEKETCEFYEKAG